MGRKGSREKQDVNKGPWSSEEDKILMIYIRLHGEGKWTKLSRRAGLKRSGKSCRLRWLNYLKPDIKRGNISSDEEDLIIRLHKLLGNRWSLIAGRLPGRTDNEIKNYWNTYLRKKVELDQKANHNKLFPGHSNKNIPSKLRVESSPSKLKALIVDPTKSPHPMIKPKSARCTKVIIPTTLAPNNNIDSINTMNNLITTSCWDIDSNNPSASTPQDDIGIGDMLIPYDYEDFHFNTNGYANCVEIPKHFDDYCDDDEGFKLDSIGEAWYENWKTTDDDYFQPEQVLVDDFLHFQNFDRA